MKFYYIPCYCQMANLLFVADTNIKLYMLVSSEKLRYNLSSESDLLF